MRTSLLSSREYLLRKELVRFNNSFHVRMKGCTDKVAINRTQHNDVPTPSGIIGHRDPLRTECNKNIARTLTIRKQ
jgi:hypothetical protein